MAPAARRLVGVLLTTVTLLCSGIPAVALNVQPVIIDLLSSGRRTSPVLTLQNTFSTTVPVELVAHELAIVDGELKETEVEAEDLLIFPAQATVEPGQSQAFRIQWVGEPDLQDSKHYFVTVAQLPVVLPENQNAIQVLYNFKVLVSVGAPGAEADLAVRSVAIETREDGSGYPVLTVANTGQTYGYVGNNRMTLIQRAPNGDEVMRQTWEPEEFQQLMGLGLVPSGATRRLPVNIRLPQATGSISVELVPVQDR
jgi:P pilus assembly chaperone PapD